MTRNDFGNTLSSSILLTSRKPVCLRQTWVSWPSG
jgi:hypothetical protein